MSPSGRPLRRTVRFEEMYVDGFGVLADESIGPLTPGVNVVVGPNEAGKSTLLAFLRAALFGFERRNRPSPRYEPLRGGKHGGALTVADEGGARMRIERHSGSGAKSSGALQLAADEEGAVAGDAAEARLAALLGGVSQRLYQNIFAFGLGELQELATLQDDEVSAYIYTAGMGLAARALPEAERRLERRLEDLFLPRGKKQVINRRLNEIDEIGRRLSSLSERPETYNRRVEQRARLEKEIAHTSEELKQLDARVRKARRLLEAWEPWQELLANREERDRLAAADETGEHDAALANRERIETASRRVEVVRAELKRIQAIRVREREANAEWESALAALGPGWDAERVARFDTSVGVKEAVRAYRDRLQGARDGRDRKVSELEARSEPVHWMTAAIPGASALLVAGSLGVAGTSSQFVTALALFLGLGLLLAAGWLRHASASRRERAAALEEAEREESDAQASWREWLRGRDLSQALSPQGALDLVAEVERVRGRWGHLSELRRQIADAREVIRRFVSEVEALAVEAEPAPPPSESGEEPAASPPRGDAEPAERRAEWAVETVGRLRDRLERALERRDALKRLDERRSRLLEQLRRIAGSPAAWEAMEAALRRSTPDEIQATLDESEERKARLEEENAARRTTLGAVGRELQEIERDEETAALRWERASAEAQLQDDARAWAVLALTRALLRTARAQYERERQPGVLRRAAALFEQMTGGGYRKVVAPVGEFALQVERHDGARLQTGALSRGTAEQLYLAMRLALAQEFASRSVALPVVMDDPLVNFDPARLRAAARVIGDFAADHQVILFTCHPHMADAFRDGSPSASVHQLGARS